MLNVLLDIDPQRSMDVMEEVVGACEVLCLLEKKVEKVGCTCSAFFCSTS
jgi:hypothetical protein